MAEFELFTLHALVSFIYTRVLWQHELTVGSDCTLGRLTVHLVFKFPQFNDPVVRRKHLQYTLLVVHKFNCVDLLVELDGLQVVELGLV